jgi:hypothetical protein
VVGLDASIFMHPLVWKASGHADKFADLVSECKKCNTRTRVDHLKESENNAKKAEEHAEHVDIETEEAKGYDLRNKVCPNCGAVGQFTQPMPFKLMFETQMRERRGLDDVYLRRIARVSSRTLQRDGYDPGQNTRHRQSARASATKSPRRPSSSAPASSSRRSWSSSASPALTTSGTSTGRSSGATGI